MPHAPCNLISKAVVKQSSRTPNQLRQPLKKKTAFSNLAGNVGNSSTESANKCTCRQVNWSKRFRRNRLQ